MESFEELIRCPICYENFTEPRTLPCGHIFCLACLQRQEDSESTKFIKTCSICRHEINPPTKASTFPPALTVQQMVEQISRMKAASSPVDCRRTVELIFKLFETRKELKKYEESRLRKNILSKKEEITATVDEAVEKMKQYLDTQKAIFLESVNAEYEKRLARLNQYSEEAEKDCKIKSWVISHIDDNFSIVTPPKTVLSAKAASLAKEPEGKRAVDAFFNTLDLNSIRRSLSNDSEESFPVGPVCHRNDNHSNVINGQVEPQTTMDNETKEYETLNSNHSLTTLVNEPVNSAAFPREVTRSDDTEGSKTLSSDSDPKGSNNFVSVSPYIVDNRDGVFGNNAGAFGLDYSPRGAAPFVSTSANNGKCISAVKVEHWVKASSHEITKPGAGVTVSGKSHQRERISSAPTKSTQPSTVTKPFVWRVRSNDPTHESFIGMFKRFKEPMELRTTVLQGAESSKRLYVHVTLSYTTIAVDRGTKMLVFMNSGNYGRRRFTFDAVDFTDEDTPPAIIGMASLPDDDGWCMLLKNTVLVFNYSGVLNFKRSFPDFYFLSALVYSSDQFVFIDKHFNIGIAGFSDEVKFLRPSRLHLTGTILGMAAGPNMLFIAHADVKRNVGTISCLSGFRSDSLVLSNDHEIHAPHGFHCPQSICCNHTGKLFALWSDKHHQRSVIVEYLIEGDNVISNTAFDEADRVWAITCSSEGRLVTFSA